MVLQYVSILSPLCKNDAMSPRNPILRFSLRGILLRQLLKNISRFKPTRRTIPQRTLISYCRHQYQMDPLQSRRKKLFWYDIPGLKPQLCAGLVEPLPLLHQTTGPRIRHDHGFHHLRAIMIPLVARSMVPSVRSSTAFLLRPASDVSWEGPSDGAVTILADRCLRRMAEREASAQSNPGGRPGCEPRTSTQKLSIHLGPRVMGPNNMPWTCVLLTYQRAF